MHYIKLMISYRPIIGLADDNPKADKLIWGPVALFAIANFATYEAIVSPKLTIASLLIFFILFVSSLIFSSSCLMYSDYSIKTLVNTLTFLST